VIRLPSTTYTLELILSAGTADVDVSYSDATTTAYTGGTQETAATATTQTICAAPAASTVRDIDFLSVKIKTTGGVVTVQKLNSSGAVVTQLISVTLLDEEELNYTHGSGWCALDANGNRKEVASNIFGALTATSITDSGLTSGRVTYAGTGGLLQDSANLTFNGTTLTANTIGAFILSGNVTQTGNPSINIGTGAFTAGATSLGGAVTFTGTAIGSAADRWIGTDGGTGMFINAPTSNSVTIGVNNTAIGAFSGAGAAFTTFRTNGYTVGTLPAGVTGMRVYVTDATVPTYNGALVGGGAVTIGVFYNGAAWVSA